MFDFTVSLPTLFIIIVIFLLFRAVDKRNRGLDKLKRFSDKAKEDLSVYIKDKSSEISELSVNLDENLAKGRDILKKILSFEEQLAEKAADFEKMKNTVDAYAGTLQELINMSARVDENLKRLGEESAFIDKVEKKVKDISGRLTGLEAELAGSQAKVMTRGVSELADVKQKLLKSHEQSVAALMTELGKLEHKAGEIETFMKRLDSRKSETIRHTEAAIHQSLKLFDAEVAKRRTTEEESLKAELDETFAEAGVRKTRAEAEVEALVAKMEQKNDAIASELESRVENAGKVTDELMKDFDAHKEKTSGELEELFSSLEKRNKALNGELVLRLEDFKEQFAQIERMYYTHLTSAAKKGEDFEDEVFINLKKSIQEKSAQHEKDVERYFSQVHAALDKRKKEIVNLFGALRSDTHIWHAEMKKQMAEQGTDLDKRLSELEDHTRGSIDKFTNTAQSVHDELDGKVSAFITTTQAKIEDMEETFNSYSTRLAEQLESTEEETEKLLEKVSAKSGDIEMRVMEKITDRLALYEEEVSYKFGKLEEANVDIAAMEKSLKELMRATAEKIHGEFDSFSETLVAERIAERKRADEELSGLREEIESIGAGVTELKTTAYENVSNKLKLLEDDFFGELAQRRDALDKKVDEWQEENASRLESIASSSQGSMQKLGEQFQKVQQKEIALLRKEVEKNVQEIEERVKIFSSAVNEQVAEKKEILAGLRDQMEEIDRSQKNFVAQTKIFERADTLKLSLESDITQMKKDMAKLDAYRKEMDEFAREYFQTKKLVEDVVGKMRDFVTEKKRIDMIEGDYKKLMDISISLDEKLEAVTSQHDMVQEMELKLRELASLEQDVEERFNRLEGRKKVIDTTTQSVDKNFTQLSSLEKLLKTFERDLRIIPKTVAEVRKEVELIASGREKTDKVVSKIEKLDDMIAEIEDRAEKMNVARDWLARAETRFEKVNKEASEQLRLLETLLKEERTSGKKEKGAPSVDTRATVTKLARQGWSVEEIARATKLSRGEVELILELVSDKVR